MSIHPSPAAAFGRHTITTAQVEPTRNWAPAKPARALVVVESIDSSRVGMRWSLDNGDITLIGREVSDTNLNLRDPGVSRLHARCSWDERLQGVVLTDVQSRNGTFVETRPVRQELLLRDGAVIRVGHSLLVFTESDGLEAVQERARQIARTELTVLLGGETGTGKERFARMIHDASGRRGPFVAINCASISKELVAAELFGHTKMAFSGAMQARKGVFAAAEAGSILLDEIGDCPPDVQVALLRVLQEKAVRPVGGEREIPIDTRVIAATHQNLESAVQSGKFRADLYARLKQASLVLPPLRMRKSELLLLAKRFAHEEGSDLTWTVDAAEALLAWSWPFNVRELQSLVRTFVATRGRDSVLDLGYLNDHHPELARAVVQRASSPGGGNESEPVISPPPSATKGQRQRLCALLTLHGGNVSKVAEELGKPRAQVYRWMRVMGLSAENFGVRRSREAGYWVRM